MKRTSSRGGARRSTTTNVKYKYTKYVPNLLDELDMDELMSKLSDLLMSSGFGNPRDTSDDSDRTMQALHDAILEALFNGGVLPDDMLEKMFGDKADGNEEAMRDQLEQLIQQIIEQMKESGYISTPPDLEPEKARRAMGGGSQGEPAEVKFEVTDKALDFLGYRALRDLLGSAGHSSAGRHDTRDLSTGIEASGAPKPYEFGDVMNLDVTATILNAVKRTMESDLTAGAKAPALQTSAKYNYRRVYPAPCC
jgi:Ca-activated chloride channel homolog